MLLRFVLRFVLAASVSQAPAIGSCLGVKDYWCGRLSSADHSHFCLEGHIRLCAPGTTCSNEYKASHLANSPCVSTTTAPKTVVPTSSPTTSRLRPASPTPEVEVRAVPASGKNEQPAEPPARFSNYAKAGIGIGALFGVVALAIAVLQGTAAKNKRPGALSESFGPNRVGMPLRRGSRR